MKSWTPPTTEQLQQLSVLAARPENRKYFFDRLQNPNWVTPLRVAGFFRVPPAPVPAGEPGFVRFPPWPEGGYLVRVAALAPVPVAGVLRETPPSDNPIVTRDLLQAAAALPDNQLRELASKVTAWVGAPFAEYFADEAAAVIARFLEMGDVRRGLSAAAILLAVQPDPQLAEKAAISDSPLRPHPEAAGRLSEWEYRQVLERLLAPITDGAGIKGLRFIASLLDDALRASRWDDEDEPDGHSFIWRPAIEDHAQNSDTDVKDVLTSAMRDAAVRLSTRGEDHLEDVVRELEAKSILHRRIALHTIAAATDGSSLVGERLRDRALFDDHGVRHEYATLLRRRFADADAEAQRQLLDWIAQGPDLDAYQRRRIDFDSSPPSDEDVERYARSWRRDWYSFVAEHLRGDEADRYRDLVAELGQPEHPDFLSWSSSWTGPESPMTRDQLLAQSPTDVVEYLRTWAPEDDSGWHFGPSMEGLGRIFAEVVKEQSADYAAMAECLTQLDPTYVRGFFSALEGVLREGGSFPWEEPLRLAAFVVQQPVESDEEAPDRDRDPGWRWCRRAVASLLRAGFADKPSRIPYHLRGGSWELVNSLTNDPNPSPEHEERYGGDNMDPLTLSINTNRGTAMHAAVEYALWIRREAEAIGDDVSRGFDIMPEVGFVLERHLDPRADPSLAVRSVYGRWLPWLLLLDERWVAEHVAEILPSAPEYGAFRDTAWATYVSWCPPYDSVYRALRAEYNAAVQRVPSGGTAGAFRRRNVDAKLGEHLVTLYWRGVASYATVDEFFDHADDELAGHVMEFVGRSLRDTDGAVPEGIAERIQQLWDRRLEVIARDPEPHRLEAGAFGISFASAKLADDWALNALERVVEGVGAPRLAHLVVRHLVDVVQAHPAAATRVLVAMLKNPQNEWDYLGWTDEARTIVAATDAQADPDIANDRADIIDIYVRRGQLDFREFVARRKEPKP